MPRTMGKHCRVLSRKGTFLWLMLKKMALATMFKIDLGPEEEGTRVT